MKVSTILSALVLVLAGHTASANTTCSIQAFDGHYLTAVGGGGRTTDVIHSNANAVGAWEKFEVRAFLSGGGYALKTVGGKFVTAVGGGGRTTDVIHTDASVPSRWERFQLVALGGSNYAIKTMTGNYLTAQDSGGRITDVIHSNATSIGTWEKFRFNCGL
jgi:hypothetical protein